MEPRNIQEIVGAVEGADMSNQVYAISILANTIDTEAERQYLPDLAESWGWTPELWKTPMGN